MLFYVGRFSYNFTCNILVYLGSFSCTLHASSCGQFLLHVLCCFMSGVSLTHPVLFPVGSFTDTLDAVLCGEFLLHASCCSIRGMSLTRQLLFYVGIFLTCPLLLYVEVSLTPSTLFNVGSLSSTPHVVLCTEFLLHAPCRLMWGISLTRPLLFYVRSFSYTHFAVLCGEFLLHTPCCFMWGASLSSPLLFYVGSLTPHWSKTLRKNQSQWKRETTAARSVRLQRGTPCIHSCTRRRLCWYQDGKHGPIGAQRPLAQVTWQSTGLLICGRESLLHAPKLVLWAGFSYTCHMLLLGETFLLHVLC